MRWLALIILYFSILNYSIPAQAMDWDQFRLLDIDYFSIKGAKFTCNRDPAVPDVGCKEWIGRVATDFDLSIAEYLYWRNQVHGEGTEGQFRTMGWHYELGLRAHRNVEIFYEHHSRHVLDESPLIDYHSPNEFPVEDSYGIRLIFFKSTRTHQNVIGGQ